MTDLVEHLRQSWAITARGAVNPWECDDMGHMNVKFYMRHLEAARERLAFDIGLDRAPRARDLIVNFMDEMPGSASLQINSAIVGILDNGLAVAHLLTDPSKDNASTSFYEIWDGAETSLTPGHFPEEARALFSAGRAYDGLPDWPLAAPETQAMPLGIRTRVLPSECEADGTLSLEHHINRLSDGAGFQWKDVAGEWMKHMVKVGRGGAVVSYYFRFLRPAHAGDLLETRIGVLGFGTSSFSTGNMIYNVRSGELVASARTTLVHFDLKARKAIPLTDAMRTHLEAAKIK